MADENNSGEEVSIEETAGEVSQVVEQAAAPAVTEADATPEVEVPEAAVAEESVAEATEAAEPVAEVATEDDEVAAEDDVVEEEAPVDPADLEFLSLIHI